MNEVISVTNNAIKQLKKIMNEAPSDIDSLIVGVDKSGCNGYSYKLDFGVASQVENFDLIKKDGINIYIDPKATMFLIGSTMDYKKDNLSSRFVFDNPNEKSTCGCGESFNI